LKYRVSSLLLTVLLWCSPLVATATVVLYMDLSEMTSVSQVIVHAKVVDSSVIQDANRPITTRTTIEAIEIYKGKESFEKGRLWFDLLGGEREGMQIRVPGTPTFRAGEEVILFLEKNSTDYALCGLMQGVFRVQKDQKEERLVSRDLSGAGYAQFGDKGKYSFMHDAPKGVTGYPLKSLKEEITMYVTAKKEVAP